MSKKNKIPIEKFLSEHLQVETKEEQEAFLDIVNNEFITYDDLKKMETNDMTLEIKPKQNENIEVITDDIQELNIHEAHSILHSQ